MTWLRSWWDPVSFAVGLLVVLALALPCRGQETERRDGENCTVERIIDGDTFVCEDGEHVRLLLVNTPETHQEPYGPFARNELAEMIPSGTRVRLSFDVDRRDRYGRLLAHVHGPDGKWINRELARRGYAEVMVVPPNVRGVERIRTAARKARQEESGFWDDDVLSPTDPSTARGDAAGTSGRESRCHPSYPDVCLPPPPPDLDCADVVERDIRVRGEDPHRLDGDDDGRGCEG